MAARVVVSGKWKDIKINPNIILGHDFSGFGGIQELTNYDIVYKNETLKKEKRKKESIKHESSEISKAKEKKKKKRKPRAEDTKTQANAQIQKPNNEPLRKRMKTSTTDDGDETLEVSQGEGDRVEHTLKKQDMTTWKGLFVPPPVLRALAEKGFTSPTPIQALALGPAIRDRMDIVGAAETGSGKTLAFGIPLIHRILELKKQADTTTSTPSDSLDCYQSDTCASSINFSEDKDLSSDGEHSDTTESEDDLDTEMLVEEADYENKDNVQQTKARNEPVKPLYALILTPTRELAIQVKDHLMTAAKYTGIKVISVVGGMAAEKQIRLLRRCPEIVVATPGRLWELYQQGEAHLSKIRSISCLVIDEADRMVEKGHFEELSQLLCIINSDEERRAKRQTFVFSATLTTVHEGPLRLKFKKKAVKMTEKQKLEMLMAQIGMNKKPKVIDLTKSAGTAETLSEARINTTIDEKDIYLYYFLFKHPGRTLVFANSKDCIRRLISVFKLLECCPLPLHADMHQRQRLKNLDRFKSNPRGLLLATDVAARGLDIPDVQHVIHYQVPRTTENYIHRSGRTARASKVGLSIMFVGPEDLQNYRKIIKSLNRDQDLPLFPVDQDVFLGLKIRVNLARSIDKDEHRLNKKRHENLWYLNAAKEMDIDLDDDDSLLNDIGDEWEQSQLKKKLQSLKCQLKAELHRPVQRRFTGKYPTKSGRLLQPSDIHETDAIERLKEDCKKMVVTQQLHQGARNTKKFKRKKKKSKMVSS